MQNRRRKLKRKRDRASNDIVLQITSLADILIIVLVFLLKSYATDVDQSITVPSGLTLPVIDQAVPPVDGVRVEILKDKIQIKGQTIASLRNYKVSEAALDRSETEAGVLPRLQRVLKKEKREAQAALKERKARYLAEGRENLAKSQPKDISLWLVADKDVPYETIQTVMASGALIGFGEYKLAVIREE